MRYAIEPARALLCKGILGGEMFAFAGANISICQRSRGIHDAVRLFDNYYFCFWINKRTTHKLVHFLHNRYTLFLSDVEPRIKSKLQYCCNTVVRKQEIDTMWSLKLTPTLRDIINNVRWRCCCYGTHLLFW